MLYYKCYESIVSRRIYAPSGGDWRRGDQVRQARSDVGRAVRRGGPGRVGRRRARPQRDPGALLRQRGRERDREAAPHRASGRVRARHPHRTHDPVKNHRHGALNPKAQFRKEITLDTVMTSPYIADPLKLYDCCPFTDGGAAVILASEEVARRHKRAIWVLGSAAASDYMLLHDKKDPARVPATERAAAAAYRQAGLEPDDVDVVELHDCFTIAEIVATEGLGLFEPGTGGVAAEKGWTSLGGKIPVNTSGGLKAKGHPIGATGAAQIVEVVTQLRREAGPRQVDGAKVGLTHTLGGNTATVLVSVFGRD